MINFPAPSSSSYSVMSLKKYDVFLSFRGEDTRHNFISHLRDALSRAKVETYIDYRLEKGDSISAALIKAIQDSLVSVVVFSENYASSKWCLGEISLILECKDKYGQDVIPVFYKVDPSHVRKQTGCYKEAFAKHEQDLKKDNEYRLHRWRRALTEAANLAGWDSRNSRNESEFIMDIVKDVLRKLKTRYPRFTVELKGVVGIEQSYAEVEALLEIGSPEIRVIGIWGMRGLGKTTLARALFAELSNQFEGYCFLESVREQYSEKNGLVALRNRLFSELFQEENLCVDSGKVDYHFVARRLICKRVLIVLDDVAISEQLQDLISDYDYLSPGSRVIVTTRDKHIFSEVNRIYEVKVLNDDYSLELFCQNAFGKKHPKIEYEELSESLIAYCKGNPLALKVLGASLRSRSKEAWKTELRKLQKDESSRPEKHIIAFDTPSASIIDSHHTIEVSEGKDLSENQVDNCFELAMFEKSHTLKGIDNPHLKPDWDPIVEIESLLSDSYKVCPMSTHSISIPQVEGQGPNVKAILEKLESLLETSLEIINSNNDVKQQFHHVLEQLGQIQDEVPVMLHPVIYKFKTFIQGFDFRFATAQKTIQYYDQLLHSRSLLGKELESVKAQQDQIKTKVSECKLQFENVNSEIGEQENESSVLVEARERLKRDLDYYDAENSKLKTQVAQWVPECKTIITALKNSQTSYIVAVSNKKKYEDEWTDLKRTFVANKI